MELLVFPHKAASPVSPAVAHEHSQLQTQLKPTIHQDWIQKRPT